MPRNQAGRTRRTGWVHSGGGLQRHSPRRREKSPLLEGLRPGIASAGVPFRPRGYDEWGHSCEETHHVEEVTAKTEQLSDREVDVELAAKKQPRPPVETNQAIQIEHK